MPRRCRAAIDIEPEKGKLLSKYRIRFGDQITTAWEESVLL